LHQLFLLLEPECKGILACGAPGTKKQRINFVGQHVLLVKDRTPYELGLEKETNIVCLNFNNQFIKRHAPFPMWSKIIVRPWHDIAFRKPIVYHAAEIFRELHVSKKSEDKSYMDALGTLLLVHVLRILRDKRTVPQGDGFTAEQFQRVQRYIKTNFLGECRVGDIAREAGLSQSQFTRRFKNTTDKNPLEYVIEMRVQHALRLFEETDKSAVEIAGESGFGEQSYMYRCFQRIYGTGSPKEILNLSNKKTKSSNTAAMKK